MHFYETLASGGKIGRKLQDNLSVEVVFNSATIEGAEAVE